MKIEISDKGKLITAYLDGDIDHHSAVSIREAIDERVKNYKPQRLILDYGQVSFMDSSGIGLIMGRHRLLSAYGGKIEVNNIPINMYKVVKLSGIEKLGKVTVKEIEK